MTHESFMRVALELARQGLGRTSPNPSVGAVLVKDGEIVSRAFTQPAGGDHAEQGALRAVGFQAQGMDLYTTLEPCNHFGKTPPCTAAILRAGVRRVIVGARDPNPQVQGIATLKAQGVEVISGVLQEACSRLNEAFNFAIVEHRPFVVLKAAMSLDGRIATHTGHSQWITSAQAREAGHHLRNELDAILVGVKTVLADNPSLTARFEGARDPIRVVLDSGLNTPLDSQLIQTAPRIKTLIATLRSADPQRRAALQERGAELVDCDPSPSGQVELSSLMPALYEKGINSVLVEGGGEVHGSFVDAKLVNKVVFFLAPMVIGGAGAPVAVKGQGAPKLDGALRLGDLTTQGVGPDLMVCGYVKAQES